MSEESLSKDDLALYDRQIRLWGVDAQQKIRQIRVLIIGYDGGLEQEILKNLVLKGVGQVTLLSVCEPGEGGSTLFGSSGDDIVGEASALNPSVKLAHRRAGLDSVHLDTEDHDVVVVCNLLVHQPLMALAKEIRASKRPLIWSAVSGFFGALINDLGTHEYVYETKHKNRETGNMESTVHKDIVSFEAFDEVWNAHLLQSPETAKCRKSRHFLPILRRFQEELSLGVQRDQLAPVNAILGAIVSQEVVKIATGKDLPIVNALSFDGHTLEARVAEIKSAI